MKSIKKGLLTALFASSIFAMNAQSAGSAEEVNVAPSYGTAVNPDDAMRQAEILRKYASKQGVHLIEGSLADFKSSKETLFVDMDWSAATSVGETGKGDNVAPELTVSVEECIKEFNDKFIVYFNAQNNKGVQFTTNENEIEKYKLLFQPISYSYKQNKVMGGSQTMISVIGTIKIVETQSNMQIAELFFNSFEMMHSTLGKAGINKENTLKGWRIVAEKIDNGLIKLFKKGN